MLTAVQEQQQDHLNCKVMIGKPINTKITQYGEVKLFNEGQIIWYHISQNTQPKRVQSFLFRAGEGNSLIPGIFPAVNILIHTLRQGQMTKLQRIIDCLTQKGYDLNEISDRSFAKINCLIAAKNFKIGHLKQVLNDAAY